VSGPAPIVIAFALDAGYAMPTAVALRSLYQHHRADELEVHVLTTRVDDEVWRKLIWDLPAGARIVRHPVDPDHLAGVLPPPGLNPAAFTRLLMGSVLPATIGRVIYLDGDVVCRSSLQPLWATDLQDRVLGAVTDASTPWVGSPHVDLGIGQPRWRVLDLAPATPYFNAGVLLVDLARWRERGVGDKALDYCRRFRLTHGDQDGLLGACRGQWARLHPRWNMLPEHFNQQRNYGWVTEGVESMQEALDRPAVVHFTRGLRPWVFSFKARHPYGHEWLALLDRTQWRGWRPRPRPILGLRRALDRAIFGQG
jgi:lipopolysaccharide biosynthesis glycosyltransferase